MTDISIVNIQQRLAMLPNAPAAPLKGRGNNRIDVTGLIRVNELEGIVNLAMSDKSPHIAAISVRQAMNRFGKIGYPKHVYFSPEFFSLFQ